MNTITVPAGRGFYTYVHRDAAGTVLYVGATTYPLQRLGNHVANRRRSHWFEQVASIDWFKHESLVAMFEHERHLMADLRPLHNRTERPDLREARQLTHFATSCRVDPIAMRSLRAVGQAIDEWAAA